MSPRRLAASAVYVFPFTRSQSLHTHSRGILRHPATSPTTALFLRHKATAAKPTADAGVAVAGVTLNFVPGGAVQRCEHSQTRGVSPAGRLVQTRVVGSCAVTWAPPRMSVPQGRILPSIPTANGTVTALPRSRASPVPQRTSLNTLAGLSWDSWHPTSACGFCAAPVATWPVHCGASCLFSPAPQLDEVG